MPSTSIILLLLLSHVCIIDAFSLRGQHATFHTPQFTNELNSYESSTSLHAVTKRQTAIYDGAEFVSIASFLLQEKGSPRNLFGQKHSQPLPEKRAGYLTFLTGKTSDGERVLGVEGEEGVELEEGVFVYADSLVKIPGSVSDHDAISTAAAALCGVHCGMPLKSDDTLGKVIILGGGDYACFTARALSTLGAEVHLVTTRPMALKDTPLNPIRDTDVNAMPPAVGEEEVGFSDALQEFVCVIDTLGDEADLAKSVNYRQALDRFSGVSGVAAKLKRENNCKRYLSTLTQSQRILLDRGILSAREPVLNYQKKMEKINIEDEQQLQPLVPPLRYNETLQRLFNAKVTFPTDRNENGSHKSKKMFVKGCSFPDYGEYEIWPRDSTEGAPVRYGFPGIGELTLEASMEKIMTISENIKSKTQPKKKKIQTNPFVMNLNSLTEIKENIVDAKKDCIVFFSAPYCKLCRTMSPLYTRMARISREEKKLTLIFAKASTAGKTGKQLTFTFEIETVPTFVLFRKGERYGEPFGAMKLPSEKLDKAIEYLMEGREWDAELFEESEEEEKQATKLK